MLLKYKSWYLAACAALCATSTYAYEDRSILPIKKPVFNCKATEPSNNFINYESGQVRPLALSDNGKLLFVANTPANCLEIYKVNGKKTTKISAISVGLEPTAVAVRNKNEVWVANHLSDSVSIIKIKGKPRVTQTLLVGDEPRDIVFAGSNGDRAFITTAHRGKNNPSYKFEDFRKPGIGRADVWVYDANNVGDDLNGSPLTIISLFTDSPRALSVSPDGSRVYAASFLSGNQTTAIHELVVDKPKPEPDVSIDGIKAPETGLIVKYNGEKWVDELDRDWSNKVPFNLPDKDVFAIDANANPPQEIDSYSQVGTVLFNMAINPQNGAIYVSNTEARNEVRFEGSGEHATTLRGHSVENRITVIKDGKVTPHHLNPHVDFNVPEHQGIPAAEKAKSLAQPMGMVVTADGKSLYTTAFGSAKIVKINTESLENGSYNPNTGDQIAVPGGPSAIILSKNEKRLYVYSRFENVLTVIDTQKNQIIDEISLYNPEPESIKKGRDFFYNADLSSGNGTTSCSSCHIFGDTDGIAWDLGNPDEEVSENLLYTFNMESAGSIVPLEMDTFHPLKGPMATQTFRGMALSGPMHWRGDKTGLQGLDSVIGLTEKEQARRAFKEFNGAFVSLLGRETQLSDDEMEAFADFALSIVSYPNPLRNLDNSYTDSQEKGRDAYHNAPLDLGQSTCNSCHEIDREKNHFGTDTKASVEGPFVSQDFKVPHLRNLYQKVGMFGTPLNNSPHAGDQIKGFGFIHDGSVPTLEEFLTEAMVFTFESDEQLQNIVDFVMVSDNELYPITGQQITLNKNNQSEALGYADLLIQRASLGECDLMIHGNIFGIPYSGLLENGYVHSRYLPPLKEQGIRKLTTLPRHELTYTCASKGTGQLYAL